MLFGRHAVATQLEAALDRMDSHLDPVKVEAELANAEQEVQQHDRSRSPVRAIAGDLLSEVRIIRGEMFQFNNRTPRRRDTLWSSATVAARRPGHKPSPLFDERRPRGL